MASFPFGRMVEAAGRRANVQSGVVEVKMSRKTFTRLLLLAFLRGGLTRLLPGWLGPVRGNLLLDGLPLG